MVLHNMIFNNPHRIAILGGLVFPFTCAVCYGLSIYLGHVEPVITYISDTVTEQPLRGLFGLFLTFTMILFSISAYIRHLYVKEMCSLHPEMSSPRMYLANTVSGWMVVVSFFAMLNVAHFQMDTSLFAHSLSAFVGIGAGVIYYCLQVSCTKHMVPKLTSNCIYNLRLVLATLNAVLFIFGVSAGCVAVVQFDGKELHVWSPQNKGYVAHALSSISEWILALCYSAFVATFAHEFRTFRIQPAKIITVDETKSIPTTNNKV